MAAADAWERDFHVFAKTINLKIEKSDDYFYVVYIYFVNLICQHINVCAVRHLVL